MSPVRTAHRVERVTVKLVPTSNDRSFKHIPSTFSPARRMYNWRHFESGDYMLVPRKVSHSEVQVDIFVDVRSTKKVGEGLRKVVQEFVNARIEKDWEGLKLSSLGRPTEAEPPSKTFKRSTIEEIMGVRLES